MKCMTFGSKVLDDAIKFQKGVKNELRITNISPFSYGGNWNKSLTLFEPNAGEYEDSMVAFELGNAAGCEEADYILLDFIDARMHFEEFELSNGEKFRLTVSNFTQPHREEILKNAGGVLSSKIVDPCLWSEEELETEIKSFALALTESFPGKKIIVLENEHVLQYVSKDNRLKLVPNYENLQKQNKFYTRCYRLARKYLSGVFVPFPSGMIAVDYQTIWSYPSSCYHYISDALQGVRNHQFQPEAWLKKQKQEMFFEIQGLWLNQTRRKILEECEGRTVVMPKSEVLTAEQLTALGFPKIIPLEKEELSIILGSKEKGDSPYLDRTQYFWFLPFDRVETNLLDFLWSFGFVPQKDYLCPVLEPVGLKEFCGTYQDCFGNIIKCKNPINVFIVGSKNNIKVEIMKKLGSLKIVVSNSNVILIEPNCQELSVADKKTQILCGDNSTVTIGKEGSLGVDLTIDSGDFSDISIGEKSLISTQVVIKNTECERLAWLRPRHRFPRSSITIGDHVWLGLRVNAFSGAKIGNDSMVGARSRLKNTFPEHSIVVGSYPKDRVIRQGITWSRSLDGKKIEK